MKKIFFGLIILILISACSERNLIVVKNESDASVTLFGGQNSKGIEISAGEEDEVNLEKNKETDEIGYLKIEVTADPSNFLVENDVIAGEIYIVEDHAAGSEIELHFGTEGSHADEGDEHAEGEDAHDDGDDHAEGEDAHDDGDDHAEGEDAHDDDGDDHEE